VRVSHRADATKARAVISPALVQHYARYNAWQKIQLSTALAEVDEAELVAPRGAFFGTVLGTLNHILWGDTIWMSRWDARTAAPEIAGRQSATYTPDITVWAARRLDMDTVITSWAQALAPRDLEGDLAWYSGATAQNVVKPRWLCVSHMFNHQTHHRGQVSQMLHAAGLTPPVSDIVFMPEVS
jgi:uncharacterized damage-inducible protein DinB